MATLDDVLAALQGSGVTQANLLYPYTYLQSTAWVILLPVPFTNLKDKMATLARLPATPGMDIQVYVQGVQASPELVAANPCSFTTLASQARVQAQKVADAAGVKAGAIIGISDFAAPQTVPAAILGEYLIAARVPPFISVLPSPPASPSCSMTVQFKLLH